MRVLEGTFDSHGGFDAFRLEEGDSIVLLSAQLRRYVNPSDAPTREITIIVHEHPTLVVPMPSGEGASA